MFKRFFAQRGQTLVLYALMIPWLIFFAGVGIDLGWYYLNVSRLQNAADAAALAGSMKVKKLLNNDELIKGDDSKLYGRGSLVEHPSDLTDYQKIELKGLTNLSNYYTNAELDITDSKEDAIRYANKNLDNNYDDTVVATATQVINSWDTSEENKIVTIISALYAREHDVMKNFRGSLYYGVTLKEEVSHLFLRSFNPMVATVNAFVILSPHDKSLVTTMNYFDNGGSYVDPEGNIIQVDAKVINNWQYLMSHRDSYTGKWNHYQNAKIHYDKEDKRVYRKENVTLSKDASTRNAAKRVFTDAEVDSLNFDFRAEFQVKPFFTSDWDIGQGKPTNFSGIATAYNENWDENVGFDLRILSAITIDKTYAKRSGHDNDSDPLWVRIESDPLLKQEDNTNNSFNSVHQIVLNLNADNSGDDKRPLVIFYDGPEQVDKNTDKRLSQPVVINLNQDTNAIIYMPNSPVIINGNGHKFTGFIVAKEFRKPADENDILQSGNKVIDAYGAEHTPSGYKKFTTGYGDSFFIKTNELDSDQYFSEEEFNNKYDDINYSKITNENGITSVYKKPDAFSGEFDELYVNDLIKYRGITNFSVITFEDDDYNSIKPIQVATEDLLLPNDPNVDTTDEKFVKVFIDGKTENERYIEKTKLPYVKVRRNSIYPYVSVYDLKTQRIYDSNGKSISNGVRFVDDNSINDATRNDLETADSRFVYSTFMTKYEKNYIPNEINKVVDEDGCKYFTLKGSDTKLFIGDVNYWIKAEYKELVADYWKVTDENNETKYIRKDVTIDYTETTPENSTNPIILDSKGNMLVKEKPLSDPSYNATRPTNGNEQPTDNTRINNPAVEVVYKSSAFGLSEDEDSHYSYFGIPELERVVYTYLNVVPSDDIVDMFYTTERAKWMD